MRLTNLRSPFVLLVPLTFAAALAASPLPAAEARLSGAGALAAADGEGRSPAYRDAQRALDEARWEEAAQRFAAVADAKSADADAALYWKAYAEEKLGHRREAMQTLKALRADYPKSVWSDDAEALAVAISGESAPHGFGAQGGPVVAGPVGTGPVGAGPVIAGPDGRRSQAITPDEELQLYALDGLMQMDSARALPILDKILAGERSLQIKQRALFVLSQSDAPRARTLLVATARNGKPAGLQIEAVRSLGIAGAPEDIQALSEIYRAGGSTDTRAAVLEAFMVAGEEKPLLDAARAEADPELRGKAIELLGALGSTGALAELYKTEPAREVKAKILDGLMIAGNGKAMIDLLRTESDAELKKVIVQRLSMMNDDAALDEIERLLTEKP